MQNFTGRKVHASPKPPAPQKARAHEAPPKEQSAQEKILAPYMISPQGGGPSVPIGSNAHVIDPQFAVKQNFQDLISINSYDAVLQKRLKLCSNMARGVEGEEPELRFEDTEFEIPALRVYDETSQEYSNILKTIRAEGKRKEYTTNTTCLDEMLECNYLNLSHIGIALVILIRATSDNFSSSSGRKRVINAFPRRANSKGRLPVTGIEKEYHYNRRKNDSKAAAYD